MSVPNNSTCPYCKLPLRDYHDFVTCPDCQTSYHEKCWEENGGCAPCSVTTTPAGSDAVETLSWYLYHENKNLGPLTWEELCSQQGIQPQDLVWNSRLPDWIRADQIPNLPLGAAPPATADAGEVDSAAPAGDSAVGKGVMAAPTREEKQQTVAPVLPDGTLQQQPGTATPRLGFTMDPVPEPEEAATMGDRTQPAEDVHGDLASLPGAGVIKWKLAEPAAIPGRRPSPPPEEGAGSLSRDPARAERILDHLYREEPADSLPEPSFLDREEDYHDEHAERARKYAGHIIYGILVALIGSAAGAAIYLYAADWESMYYIGAIAASGAVALFGIIDFFRGLGGWLRYRS